MTMLGQLYYTGIGTEKNVRQAEHWLEKSAEQNDPAAMYHLGQIYFAEYSDRLHEAKELIEKAIELGPIPGVSIEDARTTLSTVSMMLELEEMTNQTIPEQVLPITKITRSAGHAIHYLVEDDLSIGYKNDYDSSSMEPTPSNDGAYDDFINQVKARGARLYEDKSTLMNLISDIYAKNEIMRNTMRVVVEDGIPVKITQLLNEDFSTRQIRLSQIIIDKNSVQSYEVMASNYHKSAASGLIRGWIGKNIFGQIGMMSGLLTMREKGRHTVSVSFLDGKKSMIEICDKRLKLLMRNTF